MKIFLYFIFASFIEGYFADKIILSLVKNDYANGKNVLSNCLVTLVSELKRQKNDSSLDLTVIDSNNNIDLSVLHRIEGIKFITRTYFLKIKFGYNEAYLITSNNYMDLKAGMEKTVEDKFWNPKAAFIIVIEEIHKLQDIKELLLVQWNMYRVTIITKQSTEYVIYKTLLNETTQFDTECTKRYDFIFVSSCISYRGENRFSMSRNIVINVKRCKFKFVTHNLWPFTNFDDKNNPGVEQYLFQQFQQYAGVDIEFIMYGKDPDIMLHKVETNEVEGAMGGFVIHPKYSGNVSYTYPLKVDHMRYIMSRGQNLAQWEAMFKKSSHSFVVVVCSLFVIFVLAALFLNLFPMKTKDHVRDVLIVFGYMLNQYTVRSVVTRLSYRLIFLNFVTLAFFVPFTLQTYLLSVSLYPVHDSEPTELSEIVNTHQLLLYSEWTSFYAGLPKYRFCGSQLNCLSLVSSCLNRSLYTIVSGTHFHTYKWLLADKSCRLRLYALKTTLFIILRTNILRRGSILTYHINRFNFRFMSSGITIRFYSRLFLREKLKCINHIQFPKDTPILMKDLKVVFIILLFGYSVSVAIFVCELKIGLWRNRNINQQVPKYT